jgi:hypothetical protein
MATPPSQIRIAELDYDQILANLVEFMKADPTFSDYDFSGSGLRLLSRVLAYVTFYNSYYLSAAVNESFLDTAQLRSSVVSHAKMLGYQSHGTRSATYLANVTVVVSNTSPTTITLPRNTQFVLQSNSSVTFYNVTDTQLTQNTTSNTYEGAAITLVEGRPAQYRFTVDTNDPTQRFIIPNANVDYAHINVTVQTSATVNTITSFQEASDLLLANSTSPIYLVSEAYDGYPELKFGNGVIGKALDNGNIVIADYYISSGAAGNNIRGPFRINDTSIPNLVRGVTATPDANTMSSAGGDDVEDIEDIRYLAPLTYNTQNRAVTADDYKAIILEDYAPSIAAIAVFGGEDGDPNDPNERPIYGRVFIAIKPTTGVRLTQPVKDAIIERTIKPHSIVGVIPQVIDPDYIYLIITTQVKYDPRSTTLTKQQLSTAISTAIDTYANENIEKFSTSFRFSRLIRAIDDADPAISSSLTRVELQKRVFPVLGVKNSLVVKFGAPLYKNGTESVLLEPTSHRFSYLDHDQVAWDDCFLEEQNGIINVVTYDTTDATVNGVTTITRTRKTIDDAVGVIDIATGVMRLANFAPQSIEDGALDIWINALPDSGDLTPTLNRLFTVESDTITVELASDSDTSSSAGFYQGGRLR